MFPVKTVVTLHGLDVTYTNMFYQHLVVPAFSRIDRFVCVRSATRKQAVDRGMPVEKLSVITPGVDPDQYHRPGVTRAALVEQLFKEKGVNVSADKRVLLSVGRLVERKGFDWFTANVMLNLGEDYLYFIYGTGPKRDSIHNSIREHGLEDPVFLLGHVSNELLSVLYNTADLLVMPNVRVHEDMEGFGIVAVEASSCGPRSSLQT